MANFRFGKCTNVDNREDNLLLKKLGADYIEGNLSCISRMSDEAVSECVDFLKSEGLPCLATNCFFPGEIRVTGNSVDYAVIDDYIASVYEKAARLGVGVTVFGSSGSRKLIDDFPEEKAFEQLAELCANHIAPQAKKHGIVCAIEPLNQKECNLVYTTDRAMRIVRDANVPEVGLLIDFYHFYLENEPIEKIAEHAAYLRHIHISNPVDRTYPKPDDGTDYSIYFRALEKAGYNGLISLEGKCKDTAVDVPPALEIFHNA